MESKSPTESRPAALGVLELIAIALGGMVGGGIFTILGLSVELIGPWTPLAIALGGGVASLAAYSYVKLGVYYRDEGATYAFFKRTFPHSPFAATVIGWWITFGYIATLALYAYTFAAYALSGFAHADNILLRKAIAAGVLILFAAINLWSVKGMGKLEDWMVYTKLVLLAVISGVLITHSQTTLPVLMDQAPPVGWLAILTTASLTFVAYEGFQLVIHATGDMEKPEKNIPRAIYGSIALAISIYVVIAIGAILAIPSADIIRDKEYALAAGASHILGHRGADIVIIGAVLATMSAISGTLFGASRLMAVIAEDGFLPARLSLRTRRIPVPSILCMTSLAIALVLFCDLRLLLEFGSVTFLIVSLLMAVANHRIRKETGSSTPMTVLAMVILSAGAILILSYEAVHEPKQLMVIAGLYLALSLGATAFSRKHTSPLA